MTIYLPSILLLIWIYFKKKKKFDFGIPFSILEFGRRRLWIFFGFLCDFILRAISEGPVISHARFFVARFIYFFGSFCSLWYVSRSSWTCIIHMSSAQKFLRLFPLVNIQILDPNYFLRLNELFYYLMGMLCLFVLLLVFWCCMLYFFYPCSSKGGDMSHMRLMEMEMKWRFGGKSE